MAASLTLPALLASLVQVLTFVQEATPRLAAIEHPKDGISLLDVKNELLLSYLQNLVFLILLRLRASRDAPRSHGCDEAVRAKLVELRLFVEKGIWPLEEKLRFSIERFLQMAQDAEREEQRNSQARKENRAKTSPSRRSHASDSGEEDEGQKSDLCADYMPVAQRRLAGRSAAPRLGALMDDITAEPARHEDVPSGIYRPPKRDRHVMESTRPRDRADRKPNKSHTMEEFITSELSEAPLAEPSIGTTIVQGGRKMKSAQERKDEAERREYEETNLVRLPKLRKKERAQKKKEAGRGGRMQFGGEEWRDLGEGVDRIDRLTKRKGSAGDGVRALLEKSRKRGFDTADGPRASGHGPEIGERFRKKFKMLEVGQRDKGKKR